MAAPRLSDLAASLLDSARRASPALKLQMAGTAATLLAAMALTSGVVSAQVTNYFYMGVGAAAFPGAITAVAVAPFVLLAQALLLVVLRVFLLTCAWFAGAKFDPGRLMESALGLQLVDVGVRSDVGPGERLPLSPPHGEGPGMALRPSFLATAAVMVALGGAVAACFALFGWQRLPTTLDDSGSAVRFMTAAEGFVFVAMLGVLLAVVPLRAALPAPTGAAGGKYRDVWLAGATVAVLAATGVGIWSYARVRADAAAAAASAESAATAVGGGTGATGGGAASEAELKQQLRQQLLAV
jgi:hypothetical protein